MTTVLTGVGAVTRFGRGLARVVEHLAVDGAAGMPASAAASKTIPDELLDWPASPLWQNHRVYAGRNTELVIAAAMAALRQAPPEAGVRGATVVVTDDDWSRQKDVDDALARCRSRAEEAVELFRGLPDEFLLGNYRWGTTYGVAALANFDGPCLGIEPPCCGGLTGLWHALELIESGEVDVVLLAAVSTELRADAAAAFASATGQRAPDGEAAVALVLERAGASKNSPLAEVASCEIVAGARIEEALAAIGAHAPREPGWLFVSGTEQKSSALARESLPSARAAERAVCLEPALGALPLCAGLFDVATASALLAGNHAPTSRATVVSADSVWCPSAGLAVLTRCP